MDNALKAMRNENEERLDVLSEENRVILRLMFRYIAASRISLFGFENVKRDLIGMAYDCERRGWCSRSGGKNAIAPRRRRGFTPGLNDFLIGKAWGVSACSAF